MNCITRKQWVLYTLMLFGAFAVPIDAGTTAAKSKQHCGFTYDLVRELDPDLTWRPLRQGEHLKTFDAILTCDSSTATVKATIPFSSSIKWEYRQGLYLGIIPPETIVVVRSEKGDPIQPDIRLDIVEMHGHLFYSTDRELIEKRGLTMMVMKDTALEQEKEKQKFKELKEIGWEPLTKGHLLGPWDMIWTQENGRVEIEIIEEGMDPIIDEATDLKARNGNFTRKKRFPANSYFAMYPRFYLGAKVNKIIGDVWVSTNREKVKGFLLKNHTTGAGALGLMDRETDFKWRKMLREEVELE